MGCCCSNKNDVLPAIPEGTTEWEGFQRLLAEGFDPSKGWTVKQDWPADYSNDFMMKIAVKPDPQSGNANYILRGDGKYRGVTPQMFVDFLLDPRGLPGFQELREVQTLPDGFIKYIRVKAPGLSARDHCWRCVRSPEVRFGLC